MPDHLPTAPYGSWRSPISAATVVAGHVGLGSPWLDGATAFWTESRPGEAGRTTLMRRDGEAAAVEVTPAPFNMRTRVHEYGGRAFTAAAGTVVGVGLTDQRLWRLDGEPRALTSESDAAVRFAEPVLDLSRRRILAVREDHRSGKEPSNVLVAVPLDGTEGFGDEIAGGHDFVAYPRPSPDGGRLAWITWDHPDMPWDGTTLWVAELDGDGTPIAAVAVAGGREESVLQPEWAQDGALWFLSDRSGFWNLWRWDGGRTEPVCPQETEIGGALWQLGARWFALLDDRRALAIAFRNGRSSLILVARDELEPATILPARAELSGISVSGEEALVLSMADADLAEVIAVDPTSRSARVVARAGALTVDPAYLSTPQPVTYASADGREAKALFYPPANPDYASPREERPPLVVRSHGGPTGRASAALNLQIQFWTSRGFAVVDVDYGGSTGYGRAYRALLDGSWGIVDVEDCAAAASFLVAQGLADADRLAIRGGSAGGYTTLCALTFTDVFKAGASWYGVGDLEALAADTHKFESRYLDRLVRPLPQAEEVYRQRSPVRHVDRLSCPVIFLQGLDDKVVPPNQAEAMVAALRAKGLPVAYLPFAGEGHGFRKAETIETALLAEYAFFCRVFAIEPAEPLPPLEIANLEA